MPIQPINNISTTIKKKKTPLNPVNVTGYGALGFGTISAILAYKKKFKTHKYLGYLAGLLAFVHTGIIEFYHYKKSKSAREIK